MKDFDFDELDRAVNSVLTQAKTTTDKPVVDTATTTDNGGASSIAVNVTPSATQTNDQVATDDQVQPAEASENIDEVKVEESPLTNNVNVTYETDPTPEPEATPQTEPELANAPDQSDSQSSEESVLSIDVPERPVASENEVESQDYHPLENTESTQNEVVLPPVEDEKDDNTDTQPEMAHQETTPQTDEVTDQTSPDTTPQKRGKFMDVVRPSTAIPVKPRAVQPRGGVTLQPSSDFTLNSPMIDVAKALEADTTAEVATPVIASAPAPEVPQITTDHPEAVSMSGDQPANDNSTMFPQPEPEPEPEHKAMSHTPLDFGKATEPKADHVAEATTSTPFIPDVAVDKRPLNSMPQEDAEEATDDTSATPVATVSTTMPKEFNKEILEIDSKETAVPSTLPVNSKPATFPVHEPSADAKGDSTTPHPMFDTASVHQPLIDTKSSASHKTMWLLIFIALFVVGAALGMLYFLYGQQ